MNKIFLLLTLIFVTTPLFAKSRYIDDARLRDCGGRIELRESQDNLHLKLDGVKYCNKMTVYNTYGEVIHKYKFKKSRSKKSVTASYTLSREMWQQLDEGKIEIRVSGRWAEDRVSMRIYESEEDFHNPWQCGGHTKARYTGWALTSSCKCAYYRRGDFIRHAKGLELLSCLLN